ncbi:ovate family protein [Wolffia australiana]
MSSSRRKFTVRHPVVVDLGCGCRRGKLSSFFSSQSKTKPKPYAAPSNPPSQHHRHYRHPLSSYYPFSPSTSATSPWETSHNPSSISTTTAASIFDDEASSPANPPRKRDGAAAKKAANGGNQRRRKGRVGESVAVEKDSEDPFVDFRDSMLQMIMEKEIFAWDDLQDLLHRFLALNAPCYHDIIVRAFYEIWNSVFSYVPAAAPPADGGERRSGKPRRR